MEPEPRPTGHWLPLLLQAADPLFPTGAYAHSFGLEELVRLGVVRDERSLAAFLEDHLMPQLEGQELPYLRFAYDLHEDLNALGELDCEIDAWKLAEETREASVRIGTRRLNALRVTTASALLERYAAAVAAHKARGHHLCVCALQAHVQRVPLDATLLAYAYLALSGACTAALKLIRIGQDGVQRALSGALPLLEEAVQRSLTIRRDEAGCFAPLLEIASMRHATARERLFIS